MPPSLTVVLPAYNEAGMLEEAVRDVTAGMRERARSFEIVVVENGSSDDTAAIANRLAGEIPELRALSLPEPDYGRALRAGLLAAVGDVIVNFDVDFCDLGFLDRAVPMVEAPDGPAVVVGSKRLAGSADTRGWQRRLITNVFSSLLRVAFGLSVSDTHGVKAFRREVMAPLAVHCRNGSDLFDTELIIRAERAGLRSAEIPVEVVEKRPARSSIRARIPRTLKGLLALRVTLWREHLPGPRALLRLGRKGVSDRRRRG